MTNLFEVAARTFNQPDYTTDPAAWVTDRLGEHLWSAQVQIAASVRDHRYTAVRSCHGAGKSFIASRLVCWWLDVHPPGTAFAVTTAPTAAQVSAILWREIGKAHRKGHLPGKIIAGQIPGWKLDGELVAYGRKPADYDQAAFQGVHALHVLVVVDEACGVPKSLYDAVDALATNEAARVLAIGNPDDPATHFATICKPASGWHTIHIDGLATPNMTAAAAAANPELAAVMADAGVTPSTEPVPDELRPLLLSPTWVAERARRWGVGSSLWAAKVRGAFPDDATEGVIPLGWVLAAQRRHADWVAAGSPDTPGRLVLGVDVARSGPDLTAFATRKGPVIRAVERHAREDTMTTTGRVAAKLAGHPHAQAVVDVIGVGAGVVDRLREQHLPVVAFNAAARTDLRDSTGEWRFPNCRSAAWWHLRELLDPAYGSTVALPDDEDLAADLTAPRWQVRSGGLLVVESKDDIRKRLGRSTDAGDAVMQAFWVSGQPTAGLADAQPWTDEPVDGGAVAWTEPDEQWAEVTPWLSTV